MFNASFHYSIFSRYEIAIVTNENKISPNVCDAEVIFHRIMESDQTGNV